MEEIEKKYLYDYFMQELFHQDIENFYTEREIKTAKKQKLAKNAISWWEVRDAWNFI
ncbi:hypothetical protein C1645_821237 [Glomus cerebriforme]|uniref:Uncharacterized protein n=1 Tax=Glomus cerebriforme TaxID=658196 RepID=A0A397T0J6_9GLOM|nr:hypothetical protein C1645_821237 [Glomus cerebriforme]